MSYKVGDRIRFAEERLSYTVQAVSASGRYLACTKPFYAMAPTCVLYTVVDLVARLRGVDNTIGNSAGYETREQCIAAVRNFECGKLMYSHRSRPIPLNIIATPQRRGVGRRKRSPAAVPSKPRNTAAKNGGQS